MTHNILEEVLRASRLIGGIHQSDKRYVAMLCVRVRATGKPVAALTVRELIDIDVALQKEVAQHNGQEWVDQWGATA